VEARGETRLFKGICQMRRRRVRRFCMQLQRCSDQKHATLEEFYSEFRKQSQIGETMLALIARLRRLEDQRKVWGLTSHERLCLLSQDSWETPWFVKIVALDPRNYFIEYLMPERVAPWKNAYVTGEACSEDDAIRMIFIAMEKSEGWR